MGTARAPVVGSGTAPAWTWRVSKPHSGIAVASFGGFPGCEDGRHRDVTLRNPDKSDVLSQDCRRTAGAGSGNVCAVGGIAAARESVAVISKIATSRPSSKESPRCSVAALPRWPSTPLAPSDRGTSPPDSSPDQPTTFAGKRTATDG